MTALELAKMRPIILAIRQLHTQIITYDRLTLGSTERIVVALACGLPGTGVLPERARCLAAASISLERQIVAIYNKRFQTNEWTPRSILDKKGF
jgi:hypothetical protein